MPTVITMCAKIAGVKDGKLVLEQTQKTRSLLAKVDAQNEGKLPANYSHIFVGVHPKSMLPAVQVYVGKKCIISARLVHYSFAGKCGVRFELADIRLKNNSA